MTSVQMVGVIFGIMLVFMALRVPIAISMFVAGAHGYIAQTGWLPFANFLNNQAFARFASYDLSVIPLFILMGHFATQGGISKALFQFAASVMGRFKGGLAMAAVLASAAFGSICGSSVATAATITGVALPEMKRHGYSGRLSTGTLAAGGTLGILIPPSVPLVIYAILTEQNIAKLFAAAMVPGLIATVIFVLPAPIRLTYLGISTTPTALMEAATAFGATPRQRLWKVELPYALPQIMAGLNQTIMLSLSMVVIAALVGANGLGVPVIRALNSVNTALGFESGFIIVVVAILLDRSLRMKAK